MKVRVVDDASEVRALLGVSSVEPADVLAETGHQIVVHFPLDQHIVGSNTRLASIKELAPSDPLCG